MTADTCGRIVVDGVALSVRRRGSGIPVVCLSAIGHDAGDFAALAERIGDRFELICVEWPGHGDSGPDTQPVSARRYSDLVAPVVRSLGIERPILLGNSIGGAVAVLCAARCDARALVLCNSGGFAEITPQVRKFCGLFERFFAAGGRGAWWFGAAFALYYRLLLRTGAARAQRERIVSRGRQLAPLLREAWHSFGQSEADIRDIAAALTMPVWIAWARLDRVIPLRVCLPALQRIPNASISEFAAGHAAFLECPDEFAAGFRAFTRKMPRTDPHESAALSPSLAG